MNNEIKINGKTYKLKEVDFNGICVLEDLGFSATEIKNKTFSSMRACFAYHAGLDLATASKEIEEHFKGKGKFEDFAPFIEKVVNSDFFQNLS